MNEQSRLSAAALELRNAFDQAYAVPALSSSAGQTENLIGILLAGHPWAIRVSATSGIANGRKIVPLPGPVRELLGVAGFRGKIVPVFDLAALLGLGRDGERARWLALHESPEAIGFAFAEFEGYLRVPRTQVYEISRELPARAHVKESVHEGSTVRGIIDISSLAGSIRKRRGESRISRER